MSGLGREFLETTMRFASRRVARIGRHELNPTKTPRLSVVSKQLVRIRVSMKQGKVLR